MSKETNLIQSATNDLAKKLLVAQANSLLIEAGSSDPKVAESALQAIAQGMGERLQQFQMFSAVDVPLRDAVLDGDIVSNIFVNEDFSNTNDMRYPISFLTPGTEDEHVAYVMPDHGKIPDRRVEGDYIMLSTYAIANSIDCTRNYLKNARWDVLRRMIETLTVGFVKKNNDDGWQTLLAAADGRNIVAFDPDAAQGNFTPKLVSAMKTVMTRNAGGNSSSVNRFNLTDLYVSLEALEDMTSWGLNLVPDSIRETIHRSSNGAVMGMYGVNFHDLVELGVGQEYQLYYQNILSGSLAASDDELVIGLDLGKRDKSFIRPMKSPLAVYEDNTRFREGLASFWGTMENGWSVLDLRAVLAGSF